MKSCRPPHLALTAPLALALAMTLVAPAQALPPPTPGTLQLSWDRCYVDGAVSLRTFACNTNSGGESFFATVTPGIAVPLFNAYEMDVFVIMPNSAPINLWWQIAGCRSLNDLTWWPRAIYSPAGCSEVALGGGGGMYLQIGANGRSDLMLLHIGYAGPSRPLGATENILLARFDMSHTRTTGTNSCAGCASPVLIGFERARIESPGTAEFYCLYPNDGTESDVITWQAPLTVQRTYSYSEITGWHKSFSVINPTATTRPTWGGIKALYR